ncbi:vasoactive intestinal polypeptide receptor 2 [Discoglossus pictus]
MKNILIGILLTFSPLLLVNAIHPECRFILEMKEAERKCMSLLAGQQTEGFAGCKVLWDNITCWHEAKFGETVTITCPDTFFTRKGNLSRRCTGSGWSDIEPDIIDACGYVVEPPVDKIDFYVIVKAIYTFGHSASLIALTIGSAVLCLFRKLHCTRNYIHLNLFISFILKAISVLVKDAILYSSISVCPDVGDSLIGCKFTLVFLQYCVMANFYWLLVEGLYLHTLLVVIFSPNRHFKMYMLIGWGVPTVFIIVWIVTKMYLDDTGCWDTNEHSIPWWIIRIPIIISIILNFFLFINIIRILLEKIMSPDVGVNDQSQYMRLTKSTLLLIPLFGIHYMVFTVFPMPIFSDYKIWFELCIGSFQGLVVVILYCFLNTEVQGEIKRKWRSICMDMGRDYRLHSSSISRNGSEAPEFHRKSRAQSILQTETSVI